MNILAQDVEDLRSPPSRPKARDPIPGVVPGRVSADTGRWIEGLVMEVLWPYVVRRQR